MTREEYFAHPALNQSRLKKLLISEKAFLLPDAPETKNMKLGTLAHQMTIEPNKPVVVYPGTRRGKEWDSFQIDNADKTICIQSEYDAAHGIAESLKGCELLKRALSGNFEVEKMVLFNRGGIQCKAMKDIVNHDLKLIIDLKTAREIGLNQYQSASYKYGYHLQDDFYRSAYDYGYDMVFVVVESKPPYDFGVFRIDDELREYSRLEMDGLIKQAIELDGKSLADANGIYPNNGEPMTISFPKWKAYELMNDEESDELTDNLDW
jgi:hypothetical protein